MKKWLALLLLAVSPLVYADTKISAMTSAATMADTDILPIVATPGGTPASKQITKANMLATINTSSLTVSGVSGITLPNGAFPSLTIVPGTAILNPQIYPTGTGLVGFGGSAGAPALKAGLVGTVGSGIDAGSGALQAGGVGIVFGVPSEIRQPMVITSSASVTGSLGFGVTYGAVLGSATITADTTMGSPTSTTFGNLSYTTINSSGSSQNLTLNINGQPSGGVQNQKGGFTINAMGPGGPAVDVMVIHSSYPSVQAGSAIFGIWQDNSLRNDPDIWIHDVSNNSAPDIRIDRPSPNVEMINTSTDNAHGYGKWEPFASAYQSIDMQCGSNRAYDNSTFENLCYMHPLDALDSPPGPYYHAQDRTNDSSVLASSDTSAVSFYTLNSHTVGLTGPSNSSASYTFGLPDTVGSAGLLWYNSGSRGGNFNVRQMKHTGTDFTYLPTVGVTMSTTTISSMTVTGGANFIGSGDGQIILTVGLSTYTVTGSSAIPAVGSYAVFSDTWGHLVKGATPGGGSGTPSGNPYDIQYASANGTQFAGSDNFQNNGTTITATNVVTTQFTNVSTFSLAGAYVDFRTSTITATAFLFQDSSVTVLGSNGLTVNSLTASLPVQTDANKKLVSSAIDLSGSQATGVLAAGREPAHTGDVTNSAASLALTFAPVSGTTVTFTSSGTFANLTVTKLSASLPVQTDANKTLTSAAIDLSGTQATGALAGARFPALTGDITTSAGSLATTAANTQANIKTFTASSVTVTGASGLRLNYTSVTQSSGTPLTTDVNGVIISSSSVNLYPFTAGGTFNWGIPSWGRMAYIHACGGGGGGGGGEGEASAAIRSGAGGGGGAFCWDGFIDLTQVSATSLAINVSTGGAAGAGGSTSVGGAGAQGPVTSIYIVGGSTLVYAWGGGGGGAIASSGTLGGAGGSAFVTGATGINATTAVGGGRLTTDVGIGLTGAGSLMANVGLSADWGGASGAGGSQVAAGSPGGVSAHGGAGGGSSNGCTVGNVCAAPGAGGMGGSFTTIIGGGGAAGTSGASCTAGTGGSAGNLFRGGSGGGAGGGDTNSSAAACTGGTGGTCGGAGGAGGPGTSVGAPGGNGGAGCVYLEVF